MEFLSCILEIFPVIQSANSVVIRLDSSIGVKLLPSYYRPRKIACSVGVQEPIQMGVLKPGQKLLLAWIVGQDSACPDIDRGFDVARNIIYNSWFHSELIGGSIQSSRF